MRNIAVRAMQPAAGARTRRKESPAANKRQQPPVPKRARKHAAEEGTIIKRLRAHLLARRSLRHRLTPAPSENAYEVINAPKCAADDEGGT